LSIPIRKNKTSFPETRIEEIVFLKMSKIFPKKEEVWRK